ncbi:MAG: Calx-beta domain-containing protein [Rhodocyclaceae bacterium]
MLVNLGTPPAGVTVADGQGSGTINDVAPTLTFTLTGDATVVEGSGANYAITLTGGAIAAGQSVTLNIGSGLPVNTATEGVDYNSADGTLTITGPYANGAVVSNFSVGTTTDALYEGSETFTVSLIAASVGSAVGSVLTTITDSDSVPTVSNVTSNSATEGSSIVHTVTLSNASSTATTFALSLADVTATGGGTDYTSALTNAAFSNGVTISGGVITVPPGVTSFTVSIPTAADTIDEPNETYTLTVGSTSGTGTINDDDPTPSLSINDISVNEAAGTATFTVTLSAASGQAVTVGYNTGNGTAVAGSDYTSTSGTLMFAPGTTTQTITVPIINDTLTELSETFRVNLVAATNATISDNQGIGTILDNDALPTTTGASVSGTEDQPYQFTWADFNVSDVDTAASGLSIRVMSLPVDGALQYLNGATWSAVTATQVISQVDIAAGRLRFSPDLHESGADAFGGAGTGNRQSDYANFTYQAYDGIGSSATTTARIDISPVADAPTLLVANAGVNIFNTGWETAPNSGTGSQANSGTTLEGWTRVDTPNNRSGGSNTFETWATNDLMNRQSGGTSSVLSATGNGSNWLELSDAGSSTNQTIGISRTVATQNGLVYDLSLDHAGHLGYSAAYTRINVLVDGVSIGKYSAVSPNEALDWSNLRFSFVGNGSGQVITILTDPTATNSSGNGAMVDDINLRSAQGAIQGNANGGTETSIGLGQYVTSALVDSDTSEVHSITFNGIPAGAMFYTASAPLGLVPLGGSVTFGIADLATARIVLPSTYSGPFSLGVVATTTEPNGSTAQTTGTLNLEVLKRGVSVTGIDDPGINDAPIANDDAPIASLTEDAAATTLSGNALTGSGGFGNVADSDPEGNAITVTGIAAGTPAIDPVGGVGATISGLYGTLTIAANGAYLYTLDNSRAATQNLIAGQVATEVFTYKISDGASTDTATITLLINGAQDLTAITPPSVLVNASGLNGEYYGYNDSTSPASGSRLHADDGLATFGGTNLNAVEDMELIINGRNAARGGSDDIVGGSASAVTGAPEVRFTAKDLDYGFSPEVNSNLGANANLATGTALSTTNDTANNAFSTFLDSDDASAMTEQGAGATSLSAAGTGMGRTTDSAIRLSGQIFFERGNYDFRVVADDGFRLKVAGETLIEFDGNQAPTSRVFRNVEIDDRIEGLQPFELLYWEQGGNARLRVEYKLSSETSFKLLSLDNVALFSNENAPIIVDRRTQEIAETATNRQYELRTGAVLDGDNNANVMTGNSSRDFIQGGGGNDVLYGMAGADYLEGGSGNDTLYGGDGPDILDGGTGADTMVGGLGDDVFIIDNSSDTVSDSGGTDSVELAAAYNQNYTLGTGFENVKLQGSNAINATGNAADNRMIGNDGNNVLDGGAGDDRLLGGQGNDMLIGGLGSDVFEWNLADRGAPGAPAIDVIADFTYGGGYSTIETGTSYGNPIGGTGAPAGGGDRIDLRDLLQGEHSSLLNQGSTPEIGTLLNYLDITTSGADTVIRISTTGGFAGGAYSAAAEDQRITLQGVDLYSATGAGNETQLLQQLLRNGTLVVD